MKFIWINKLLMLVLLGFFDVTNGIEREQQQIETFNCCPKAFGICQSACENLISPLSSLCMTGIIFIINSSFILKFTMITLNLKSGLVFVITLTCLLTVANSYRILCPFPTVSHSHFIVIEPLLIGLAEKGHDVTVIGPHPPRQPVKNYRHIFNARSDMHSAIFDKLSSAQMFKSLPLLIEFCQNELRTMMANDEVQKMVAHEKFDLVIVEGWVADPLIGLGQHFNASIIEFSSVKATDYFLKQFHNPIALSYAANIMGEYRAPLNFKQRVYNILFYVMSQLLEVYLNGKHERVYNELFPQPKYLTYTEARNNVSAIFVTQHFTEVDIRPMLPTIIEVGGLHLKDTQNPLPDDLQKWMDSSENGVIFMSLGSNLKCLTLPSDVLHELLSVFRRLKENVLWKSESEDFAEVPANVRIMKWVPQTDILQHRNLKLFITHGGLGSVTEAKYHAVPLLVIPMFADQMPNGFNVEYEKWGIRLPYVELTADKFYNSIRDLIDNEKYRDEVNYRSMLFRDRPMSALDTAIYWTEYVIRHRGATHLQPNSRHLNFFQLHSFDVIAFLFSVSMVILFVNYRILRCLLSKCVKKYKTD